MIHHSSTVIQRFYNGGIVRTGIEKISPGDYIRVLDAETMDYSHAKVISIVKVSMSIDEIHLSNFDTILATSRCKFYNIHPKHKVVTTDEAPSQYNRLLRRDKRKIIKPFILKIKKTNTRSTFYDLIMSKPCYVLVDGYAKHYDYMKENYAEHKIGEDTHVDTSSITESMVEEHREIYSTEES
jgi:hypothetical protein